MIIKKSTKFLLYIILICILLLVITMAFSKQQKSRDLVAATTWQFRSVDTMKMSRDRANEKLFDESFDLEIDTQMKNIAATGATHVGIATPYDQEFRPFLKRWVAAARKYHLNVWFRGNWSGWEGWFGHEKKMTFAEHIQKSVEFIKANPSLFMDGDAFTACPECENGAQGDPRQTGKVKEYRSFLVDEHILVATAFAGINRKINTSLLSMNKDVAELVMDEETARDIGGFVTIDHYVTDPEQLVADVDALAEKTGAKIVLGEFGAPIPDLNGNMTPEQQSDWIDKALGGLLKSDNLYGLSYWVNKEGSTSLWGDDNFPKPAVETLTKYFTPMQLYGSISDELGFSVKGLIIEANGKKYQAGEGEYLIPLYGYQTVTFKKDGYETKTISIQKAPDKRQNITLTKQNPDAVYSFGVNIRKFFSQYF